MNRHPDRIMIKPYFLGIMALSGVLSACSEARFTQPTTGSRSHRQSSQNAPASTPTPSANYMGKISVTTLPPIKPTPGELLTSGGEDLLKLCTTHATKEKSYRVVFDADRETCEWGQDGNRQPVRGVIINAEQSEFELISDPTWDVICGISMETAESGHADDDLTVTFDGYIVATSWTALAHHVSNGMILENGIIKYDRNKVIGNTWSDIQSFGCAEGVICDFSNFPQANSGMQEGSFSLSMTQEFVQRLPKGIIVGSDHKIGFHTTGQVNASDCTHSRFDFNVLVNFIAK